MSRQREKLEEISQALEQKLAEAKKSKAKPKDKEPRTFIGGLSKAIVGTDELSRTLIEAREEGRLAIHLDPQEIRRPPFFNRLEISFRDERYRELKDSIEKEGQRIPIKVRPVEGDPQHKYEIAAGQRRHQACLELGRPVLAVVRHMTDAELVREMDIENKLRDSPSPYEEARQIRDWLDRKLYPSQIALAQSTQRTPAYVNILLRMLEFPDLVLNAFEDPRQIRVSWVQPLLRALKENEQAVLSAANAIAQRSERPKAEEIFKLLVGSTSNSASGLNPPEPRERESKPKVLRYGRRRVLTLVKRNGSYLWRLDNQVPEDVAKRLHALIEEELLDLLEQAGVPK